LELNAILHFNFENHFYIYQVATCAVVKLGDNGNCQFYGKAVNKRLQNGRVLVNDPFVGKLYLFAINHASGLRLNKKRIYLPNQVKKIVDTKLS
jgi:hypothetical protein